MSQWTHINAVVRFDCMSILGMRMPDLISTVPEGSEGPMHVQMWQNPNPNSMAQYTVMFWGDLRDYDDVKEILAYFDSIVKGQMIRSGLLEIDVEGSAALTYRIKEKEWVELN